MATKPPRGGLRGLGTAFVGLSLAVLLLLGQQVDYLSITAAPMPAPTSTQQGTAVALSFPTPSASAGPSSTPVAPEAFTPTPTPRPVEKPARLRIPRIGVDAPVVEVGLAADGQLQSPRQAHQVGWYAQGVKPGQFGNALLDGHLDWLRSTAVFYQLGKVEPGDAVIVITATGEEVSFVVEWKALYEANKAPMDRIFGPTTAPSVTLITCGGQFDRTSQSYTHRWVVRAVAK